MTRWSMNSLAVRDGPGVEREVSLAPQPGQLPARALARAGVAGAVPVGRGVTRAVDGVEDPGEDRERERDLPAPGERSEHRADDHHDGGAQPPEPQLHVGRQVAHAHPRLVVVWLLASPPHRPEHPERVRLPVLRPAARAGGRRRDRLVPHGAGRGAASRFRRGLGPMRRSRMEPPLVRRRCARLVVGDRGGLHAAKDPEPLVRDPLAGRRSRGRHSVPRRNVGVLRRGTGAPRRNVGDLDGHRGRGGVARPAVTGSRVACPAVACPGVGVADRARRPDGPAVAGRSGCDRVRGAADPGVLPAAGGRLSVRGRRYGCLHAVMRVRTGLR